MKFSTGARIYRNILRESIGSVKNKKNKMIPLFDPFRSGLLDGNPYDDMPELHFSIRDKLKHLGIMAGYKFRGIDAWASSLQNPHGIIVPEKDMIKLIRTEVELGGDSTSLRNSIELAHLFFDFTEDCDILINDTVAIELHALENADPGAYSEQCLIGVRFRIQNLTNENLCLHKDTKILVGNSCDDKDPEILNPLTHAPPSDRIVSILEEKYLDHTHKQNYTMKPMEHLSFLLEHEFHLKADEAGYVYGDVVLYNPSNEASQLRFSMKPRKFEVPWAMI